jgi:hypothetical protein
LRFAVHRPGIPEASPRSHGMPRRDVPRRVDVSVAGETAGRASEARLARTRLPVHAPAGFPAEPPYIPLPSASPHDPESLVPAGLAPRRTPGRVPRVEEGGHRLGEVAERLLPHHLGTCGQPGVLSAGGGELPALLQVARSALAARTPMRVLLDGQVPYEPGVAAVVPQQGLLGGRRKQPVPGHTNPLAISTDISEEVKRRLLRVLKEAGSTPRSR